MIFLKYVLKDWFKKFLDAKIIVKLPSIQIKRDFIFLSEYVRQLTQIHIKVEV